ncbi:respiratory nitrate reductase subunit gamma [Vineibacter terrae]|uniref:respiratory nitrate reductase subunit gamma n=1 Tax=Vineibacter terrae TaxID=2586908 RepID=UPI002E33691F|nr:respiratory nitrate reductase subunit gamma [Vineibacter terrae]HEX2885676.1 respiratory nitrate reductase subunit gamma [Vineibacter terrae]
MTDYLHLFVFGIYPYICLSVFLLGSLLRFDREQYTWRSGSSQLLRARQLRWGSNLFHVGILFLFLGHFVGMLTPHEVYEHVIGAGAKQLMAMISGGIAGVVCFVGLTLLLHRRLLDARIRATSSAMDIAILAILWLQLVLGLATIPFSAGHLDGSVMMVLSEWAQRIVTFRGGAADLIRDVDWVFKAHMFLGLTIFLIFPFGRLVHIWSAPVWYVFRPYQVVRKRGARGPSREVRT